MSKVTVSMKTLKLENRRVMLGQMPSGGYAMTFKRLEGREVISTDLMLSAEAMEALFLLYSDYANTESVLKGVIATAIREAKSQLKWGIHTTTNEGK